MFRSAVSPTSTTRDDEVELLRWMVVEGVGAPLIDIHDADL
jgi:hypothetical protein